MSWEDECVLSVLSLLYVLSVVSVLSLLFPSPIQQHISALNAVLHLSVPCNSPNRMLYMLQLISQLCRQCHVSTVKNAIENPRASSRGAPFVVLV